MSQENVEFLSRMDDAFRQENAEALVALHDPNCEIAPLIVGVDGGGPYRGHEGVRTFWGDLHGAFLDWHPDRELVCELDDAMIVRVHFRGHGKGSGATIDTHIWQAIRLQDGLALWWASYPTELEALEALGLAE